MKTCFEKLKEIHPNLYYEGFAYVAEILCPDEFNIACEPEWCAGDNYTNPETGVAVCDLCWKREVE